MTIPNPRPYAKCSTCNHGKYPATQTEQGQWVHLYEDGTFIGPCFDPPVSRAPADAVGDESGEREAATAGHPARIPVAAERLAEIEARLSALGFVQLHAGRMDSVSYHAADPSYPYKNIYQDDPNAFVRHSRDIIKVGPADVELSSGMTLLHDPVEDGTCRHCMLPVPDGNAPCDGPRSRDSADPTRNPVAAKDPAFCHASGDGKHTPVRRAWCDDCGEEVEVRDRAWIVVAAARSARPNPPAASPFGLLSLEDLDALPFRRADMLETTKDDAVRDIIAMHGHDPERRAVILPREAFDRLVATARAGIDALADVSDEESARFTRRLELALRDEPFDAANDDVNPSLIRQLLRGFLDGRRNTRSGFAASPETTRTVGERESGVKT